MSDFKSDFLRVLSERGYIHQVSDVAGLDALAARKGVVCYVEDGKPRGFLLWDVWGKVDAARELIAAGDGVEPETLRGLLAE